MRSPVTGRVLVVRGGGRAAAAWPTSQVVSAALARWVRSLEPAGGDEARSAYAGLDRGMHDFRVRNYFTESRVKSGSSACRLL